MFCNLFSTQRLLAAAALACTFTGARAACLDNVVLVHGNSGSPSHWNETVDELKSRGYHASQLYLPNWGSKTNAGANGHGTTNTSAVKNSLIAAYNNSCTGKIDVIAHSMGVTLAMKALNELGYAGGVDTFVSVAGTQHGLNSCGVYPWNVPSATCGADGLSIGSPLIESVRGRRYGDKMYSIKSWIDEIVCVGSCLVYGAHTSHVDLQDASYDYWYGHFGLAVFTDSHQASLIMQ